MKLRIQANSITLRLQPEEVRTFCEQKSLSQITPVPGGKLEVVLQATPEQAIGVQVTYPKFAFTFPQDQLDRWCRSDAIGFSRKYENLVLTIEKDLPRRQKR